MKRSGLLEWQVCACGSEGLVDRRKELEERFDYLFSLRKHSQILILVWNLGIILFVLQFLTALAETLSDILWFCFIFCQHNLTFYFHPCCIIRHGCISPGLVYCNDCVLDHLKNEKKPAECCYLELTLIATKQTVCT